MTCSDKGRIMGWSLINGKHNKGSAPYLYNVQDWVSYLVSIILECDINVKKQSLGL